MLIGLTENDMNDDDQWAFQQQNFVLNDDN